MRLPLIIRLLIAPIKLLILFVCFFICILPVSLLLLAGEQKISNYFDNLIGFITEFGN